MRILLVENPLVVPTGLRDGLETHGHRVKRMTDPARAIDSFAELNCPLVIIDLGDDVHASASLCARLRLQQAQASVLLVVVLPTSQSSLVARMMDAGADDVWPRESVASFANARITVFERELKAAKLHRAEEMERQRRERQRQTLQTLMHRAFHGVTTTQFFQEVVEQVARLFNVEFASISALQPDGSELVLQAGVGWPEGSLGTFRMPLDAERLCGKVLLGRSSALIDDCAQVTDLIHAPVSRVSIKSAIAASIPRDHLPYGVISLYSTRRRYFNSSDLHFLQTIALLLAGAVTREAAQRTIERSELHLRCLMEHAHDIVAILSMDEKFTFISPAVHRSLGYNADALLGRCFRDFVHADDVNLLGNIIQKVIESPTFVEAMAIRMRHASGEWRTCDFLGKVIRGESDQWEIVINLRDVTERSRTEEQLRIAKEAAEASARTKSAFLANMSHELRTPMTAILGFTDILLMDGDLKRAPSERIENLRTVKRNGEFLLEILNDILDLSKIEAEKLDIERIPFSLPRVISDVASLMRVRSESKKLPLEFRFKGPIPEFIQSDPTRVRQILINLVGNAIKFTDEGQVLVEVSVDVRDGEEAQVCFEVADTGIGMTEEQISKLFHPFTQADASTTRRFGGTGLGLTISKRLTEMLGGTLTLTSQPGVGSRFICKINAGLLDGVRMLEGWTEATAPVTKPKSVPIAALRPHKLHYRLLLAEDGQDNQRLIAFHLQKAGAEVVIAENGQVAVDCALASRSRGENFDAILMDMQMPVLDGYMATRILRAQGFTLPIIALTANAMNGDRDKCLAAGCDDYARKPIDREQLLLQIRENIDRHLQQRSGFEGPPTTTVAPLESCVVNAGCS